MNCVLMVVRRVLILITLLNGTFGEELFLCKSSSDCGWCGFCVDYRSHMDAACYVPYSQTVKIEIYPKEQLYCHFKYELCEKPICHNKGVCVIEPIYAGPVCKCDYSVGFMGQFCDVKWDGVNPDSWYSGFAVVFDNFKGTFDRGDLYSVSVIVAVFSAGKNLQFHLESSEGYVIRFNRPTECSTFNKRHVYPYKRSCKGCTMSFPKCEILFKADVPFPYKFTLGPETLPRGNVVRGYMANVTLVANTLNTNQRQEVFKETYPVVVEFEDFYGHDKRHVPDVRLQNCGRNVQERLFYFRRNTISLNAEVENVVKNEITNVWGLWDVEEFRSAYVVSDISQVNAGFTWVLLPFSLNYSIYRVELRVTSSYYYYGYRKVANFAECYFEVRKQSVVAKISGGSRVTVNNRYFAVVLSGKESYDPNVSKKYQNLRFSWTCSPRCDKLIQRTSVSNDEVTIPKGLLEYGKTYKVTLKVSVSGLEDSWAHQEVYVSEQEISVVCRLNCLEKVVPSDPLLLEVKLPFNEQIYRVFTWTKIEGNEKEVSTDDVKCKNSTFPSYLLCVEPNTLSYGKIYYFTARLKDTDAVAGIQLRVDPSVNFSCVVSPANGTRLKTHFRISCSKPENTKTGWHYEFFDRFDFEQDEEFSGKMIAANCLGVVRDFTIVRGIVAVHLLDEEGVMSKFKQAVEIVPYEATREDIEHVFAEIEELVENNEMEKAVRRVSLLSDLVCNATDKRYMAERMVGLLSKIIYESQGIMKLGLRTVNNIITSLTKEGDFTFDQNMLNILSKVVDSITKWTSYATDLSRTASPSITIEMFEKMAITSVEALERLVTNRNVSFLDTSLEDLSPSDFDTAWEASKSIDSALNKVFYALSYRQAAGYKTTTIKSVSNQTLITAQCDYSQIITTNTNKDQTIPLKMSELLVKELSVFEELTTHFTSIRYNPFWTSRRDISTILLGLDLYSSSLGTEITRINYLHNGIDLYLKVENSKISTVTITLIQFDPVNVRMDDIDQNITVLRIDLNSRSKLFASFLFHNSSDEIKMYASDTLRPSYDLVNSSKTIISSSNSNYESTSAGPSGKFVYIGFLPGPNVPINESINFTMHFHYQLCLTRLRHKWVSRFCRIGANTNSSIVHCSCSHLSFFSAVLAVPPNEINPFIDIQLFLTLKDNWFIVVLMSCIMIAFILLGVWARHKDATDKVQRKVLVLEDNFPGDSNCYLLAVFTGCRINAGTSANVGVQIYGSVSSSRCHILDSSQRKVLKCNSQVWFLFRTPQPLGNVTKVHIWHDNSGRSPDWYCNKMVVYDLQASVVYTFFVEEWLALESSEYCEAVVLPATSEDMINIWRIFTENITFGFRYIDLGCSILAPFPRNRVSRLVKVIIFLSFTMIALLISLAFYKYTTNPEHEGIDSLGFTYGSIDIIISIETFIITSVIILIISSIFTKAYKPKDDDKGVSRFSIIYTRPSKRDQTNLLTRTSRSRKIKNKSYYFRLAKRVQSSYNRLPLSPVTLSSCEVKTNRVLFSIACLMSVLLVTFCLFFIILYGLKLGQEESKTWLATISLILLQEFVILSPLKIAIIALLLASNFERFLQIANYDVNIKELLETEQLDGDSKYNIFKDKRNNSIYKPISLMQCDLLRKQLRVRRILYNLLDCFIILAYITIICLVTLNYSIKVQSHANFHAAQMVLFNHNPKHVNFQDVHNRTLYYDYLNINLVNTLFTKTWYNKKNLNPDGFKVERRSKWWMMDKITKLVGPTMFRQIRVNPAKCSLNQITENSSVECIPNWEPDVEDDEDYGYGWKSPTHEDLNDKSSAWKYVYPSQSARLSRQGETWTTYHGGGYMTSVSSEKRETEFTMQILTESKWINEFTRVVFLHFTLFNINDRMFTEVVMIAEHLPFGLFVTRTMINSEQLDVSQSVWNAALILFVLIIVFHVIRMLWLMNREGFVKFCFKFENIYQIFVTGLGILSVLLFVVNLKVSADYIERFQRRGFDVFFNFEEIVYYSVISADCLTILFCCLSFRLLTLWPFGGSSRKIYQTLLLSLRTLARYLFLVVSYVFIFCRLISYLLNHMLNYSAFYWNWAKTVHRPQNIPDSVMIVILGLSVKLLLLYILLIFCYFYKLGKVRKEKQSDLVVLFKWLTRRR